MAPPDPRRGVGYWALVELDDVLKRVAGSGDRRPLLMQERAAERMDAVLVAARSG
jgi:hypothetical protein